MVSISRSMLLAASLLAFPLAGAMAQHDPSEKEKANPRSEFRLWNGNQTVSSNNGGGP